MPNNLANCDPEKKRKILGVSVNFMKDLGKFMAWIFSATLAIVAFYFVSEAKQELRISDNKTKSEKNEGRISDHIETAIAAFERSTKTFDKFDKTMTEQGRLIVEARMTLGVVDATQQEIKRENGRLARSIEALAKEVRKRNGSGP